MMELSDYGWSGYFINDDGEIFSTRRRYMKKLKPATSAQGYLFYDLHNGESHKLVFVHRLMAQIHYGDANGLQVNHKDGVKTNNRADNLEYVTSAQNTQHSYRMGLQRTDVDPNMVSEIRWLHSIGYSQKELQEIFSISKATCNGICSYRTWKHIV